jgi:hypothetical protein
MKIFVLISKPTVKEKNETRCRKNNKKANHHNGLKKFKFHRNLHLATRSSLAANFTSKQSRENFISFKHLSRFTMAGVESMIVEEKQAPSRSIDREKVTISIDLMNFSTKLDFLVFQTCPLLLRVFCSSSGRHHSMSEYSHGGTPSNELQVRLNRWKVGTGS